MDKLEDKLYQKLKSEHDDFVSELKELPIDEILDPDMTSEKYYKDWILGMFVAVNQECLDYSNRELNILLNTPNLLDTIYNNWLDANRGVIQPNNSDTHFYEAVSDITFFAEYPIKY